MAQQEDAIRRCHVCYDETVPGFELLCFHQYCVECLRQTLRTAVSDSSRLPLRCCDIPIDLSCAWVVLDHDDATRLLARLEEMQATNKMYCPSCNQFFNLDLVDTVGSNHSLPCPCGRLICVECRTLEHPNMTCPENKSGITVAGSDKLLLELAQDKKWKQCPSCHTMIERVSGCIHMTCSNCHFAFCYHCVREWKADGAVGSCSSDRCGVTGGG